MLRIMCKYLFLPLLLLAACNSEIYTRDGVTNGDAFYLAPRAFEDDDPVLQSWVAYSLMKSTCQLTVGGQIPARVSDYGCELTARQHLLDTWEEQRLSHADAADSYLEELMTVRDAGYLGEYTVNYFGRREWQVPAEMQIEAFRRWQRKHLRRHKPETRLIGSWAYREK